MQITFNTETDPYYIVAKKSGKEFLLLEVLIYLSQVFVFFMVAVLYSSFLSDEAKFQKFINTKINESTVSEVGYVFFASIFTLGILSLIENLASRSKWIDDVVKSVLNSFPTTIYVFGSSISGYILALALFSILNPGASDESAFGWLMSSISIGVGTFVYGCIARYLLQRKRLA